MPNSKIFLKEFLLLIVKKEWHFQVLSNIPFSTTIKTNLKKMSFSTTNFKKIKNTSKINLINSSTEPIAKWNQKISPEHTFYAKKQSAKNLSILKDS